MTINHVYCVKAKIVFDNLFTYSELSDRTRPIDDYIEKAVSLMVAYDFMTANIVDADTGTAYVRMEKDWQDDCLNEPDSD